jgi:predicted Holliday junction resolvase-like endonuclease
MREAGRLHLHGCICLNQEQLVERWSRIHERALRRHEEAAAERQKKMQETINEVLRWKSSVEYRLQVNASKEMITHLYKQSSAYTQLIMVGGYAAYFAIWNSVKDYLTPVSTLWAALAMLVSIAIFVLFEVYKMLYASGHMVKLGQKIETNPGAIVEQWKKLDQQFNRKFYRVWLICLYPSVAFALIALGFLFWGFVSGLTAQYAQQIY